MLKRNTPLKRGKSTLKKGTGLKRTSILKKKPFKRKKHLSDKYNSMMQFFEEIWDEQCDEDGHCHDYETGQKLGPQYRSNPSVYHHILLKSDMRFEKYAFCPKNIVIVHPHTHNLIHQNIEKCPKVKQLTEALFILHCQGLLTSQ